MSYIDLKVELQSSMDYDKACEVFDNYSSGWKEIPGIVQVSVNRMPCGIPKIWAVNIYHNYYSDEKLRLAIPSAVNGVPIVLIKLRFGTRVKLWFTRTLDRWCGISRNT